jgi:hypothetical protein
MKCVLCKQRAGKRYCPGVQAYICPLCCGQEREVSIDCPFECTFLQQAHRFEMERREPPAEMAFASHEVPRHFVEENQRFIGGLAATLLKTAVEIPGIRDEDLRAVLDSQIRTYETLSTGLVYETLPDGPSRIHVYRELQKFVEHWRKEESERSGVTGPRDGDVLRSLVFLRRLAQRHDNGRPRGRLFYGFLRRMFPNVVGTETQSLIVPGA